ncbi:hypothetical protein LCGC14_1377430 [marine sediment metagenome]|uniref:Uncharacterized protein n=1 Tax=marine sediment metagenome TaxID=412755 RepID=A0A0F9K3N3_9ZZZZ
MPQASFIIKGDIADFTRLDNLYKSLKREGEKLLTNWTIDVEVKYSEKQGDKPEP